MTLSLVLFALYLMVPLAQSQAATCWPAWVSTTAYNGGAQVSFNGENYQAAFWTQNNVPSSNSGPAGSGQPWIPEGACSGGTGGGTNPTPTPPPPPPPPPGEGPFGGTAAAIPGTVQAENYDTGGQGVGYSVTAVHGTANTYRSDGVDIEVTTDTGGGHNLGWTAAGQWFRYTVNVASAGSYTVGFRVAAPTAVTNGFHLSNSSGTNLSGNVNVPATGGWQTWTTVTATVTLPAGKQVLTVNQDNAGWNINYMSFGTGSTPPPPPPPTPTPTPVSCGSGCGGGASGFIFSPYKDITVDANWNTGAQQTTAGGTSEPVAQAMPNKTLTWAFATGDCTAENWAGISPALEATNVQAFVNAGKDYVLSTGGAAGSFTCGSAGGFAGFINRYHSSNLRGVDFDIESGQSQQTISNLVNAVKGVEAQFPNLRFSFTVASFGTTAANPVFNATGVAVINTIKNAGLGGNWTINPMAFDFGGPNPNNCTVVNGTCEMGESAIGAMEAVHQEFGVSYGHIEVTLEVPTDDGGEPFTMSDVNTVCGWIRSNGVAGIHYWSLDRDSGLNYARSIPSACGTN